jgi:hypothetical protein
MPLPNPPCLFRSFFLVWPFLPTHCIGGRLLLDLIIFSDAHTLSRYPRYEGSAHRRDLYLYTTFQRDRHPCPSRDPNPQWQRTSGRRPTPLHNSWFTNYPIFRCCVNQAVGRIKDSTINQSIKHSQCLFTVYTINKTQLIIYSHSFITFTTCFGR